MESATTASNGHPTSTEVEGSVNGSAAHGLTPPYWKHHQRGDSNLSLEHVAPSAIVLEDHTQEPSEGSEALWARNVAIDDYVIVSGSRTGVGAYVVYNWGSYDDQKEVSSPQLPSTT
ncbi:MAG: hypothetical protein M4579_003249 [Chaenotheca gracillima]|nr:MAG: hypothetical protein M4579_003249 [Chaenotheca gracillima]